MSDPNSSSFNAHGGITENGRPIMLTSFNGDGGSQSDIETSSHTFEAYTTSKSSI